MECGSTASSQQWCGTYSFAIGTYLYNCETIYGGLSSVQFLSDWYQTALSDSLSTAIDFSQIAAELATLSLDGGFMRPTTTSDTENIPASATSTSVHHGSNGGATAGIAAGVVASILAVVLAIVATCYFWRRRRRAGYYSASHGGGGGDDGGGGIAELYQRDVTTIFKFFRKGPSLYMNPPIQQLQLSAQEMPTPTPDSEPWELAVRQ